MKKYIIFINNQIIYPTQLQMQEISLRNSKQTILKIFNHFSQDSLYRNSIYLMLSTFISAFFGFFFWIISTRIFSPEQIGLATTLIASLSLISSLSFLGLNIGIIRYLPNSNRKADKINTVVTTVLISTLFLSLLYIIGLKYFSPKLLFLTRNTYYLLFFIIISIFFSLDSILSNVFIAYRNTKYTLYKSIIGSLIKVISPLVLLSLGTYAIFVSASFGSVITFFVSLFILFKVYNYNFKLSLKRDIFLKMFKLSFANYVANFTAGLPLMMLPILINNTLGSRQAAFFYVDNAIVTLLNAIQSSIGQSLFAEGSNDGKALKKYITKSIKINLITLLPAIICIILFGKLVLLVFGKVYSNEGIVLLRLLSISVIFTTINGLLSTILNVKGKVNIILMMCLIGPAILLALIYFALPHGLVSLGYAWLSGEGLISLIYLCVVINKVL